MQIQRLWWRIAQISCQVELPKPVVISSDVAWRHEARFFPSQHQVYIRTQINPALSLECLLIPETVLCGFLMVPNMFLSHSSFIFYTCPGKSKQTRGSVIPKPVKWAEVQSFDGQVAEKLRKQVQHLQELVKEMQLKLSLVCWVCVCIKICGTRLLMFVECSWALKCSSATLQPAANFVTWCATSNSARYFYWQLGFRTKSSHESSSSWIIYYLVSKLLGLLQKDLVTVKASWKFQTGIFHLMLWDPSTVIWYTYI